MGSQISHMREKQKVYCCVCTSIKCLFNFVIFSFFLAGFGENVHALLQARMKNTAPRTESGMLFKKFITHILKYISCSGITPFNDKPPLQRGKGVGGGIVAVPLLSGVLC